MQNWIKLFRNHLDNISGKGIGGRCVVFESDDWGSLRMPSREVFNQLPASAVGRNPFNFYDTLDTADDLEALCDTLGKFRDKKGNPAVMTANFVMANPDFEKIRTSAFDEYHWEPVERTYERYQPKSKALDMIRQGLDQRVFFPQFHAREHLNAHAWVTLLRGGNKVLREAFDREVFCIDLKELSLRRNNLMASFDYDSTESKTFLTKQLKEGAAEFNRVFGFRSQSFIAPCNVWDSFVEETLKGEGVDYIQSLRYQKVPVPGQRTYSNKANSTGARNSLKQIYTVRNVYFEPSTNKKYDWVANAMSKIEAAFFWNKPAIISTHRINYVGGLDECNRKEGLGALTGLLQQILKRWPDVEFLSSAALGNRLANN